MTPVRVTAHMAEPVVCYGDGRHLDGLLAWCLFRRESRRGREFGDPSQMDWPEDLDLPLATWTAPFDSQGHPNLLDEQGQIWGWCASDARWGDYIESSYALRKMPDADDFVRHTDSGTYKYTTGVLKPKDKTYPVRFIHEIDWYALGDRGAIEGLLREMTHLGKLSGLGMGRIQSWTVERFDDDRSVVHDGTLMRRVPASWADADRAPSRGTVRPPYWHPSRELEACYPSGTEVDDVVG